MMSKIEGGLFAAPNFGGTGRLMDMWNSNNIYFVDAVNGSSGGPGKDPETPFALPSQAISACAAGASIYVKPYLWDQSVSSSDLWYTDDIIFPYNKSGISLVGCGQLQPFNYSGVGLKPSTVIGTLIHIKSNAITLENLYLTLVGGTADQGSSNALAQCIVRAQRNASAGSYSRSYGGAIRGCRIALDKSHGHPEYAGAISLQCARQFIIEDNFFNDCLGAIVLNSYVGSQTDLLIRNNQFGGDPDNRGCEIEIWINSDDSNSIVIRDNCFADGLPNHTGSQKRFIYMPPNYTAGTGIIAGNYFSTKTTQPNSFDTDGSECYLADTMFAPGNYIEPITTATGFVSDDA